MEPSRFVTNSDGTRIAVYETGNKNGSCIYFVHGNSMAASFYSAQLNAPLLQKFHLVAFDLPGHGNSERPAAPASAYTVPAMLKTIEHVYRSLALKDAVVVAFSLGAHLVMENVNSPKLYKGAFVCGYPPLRKIEDLSTGTSGNAATVLAFKSELDDAEVSLLASEMQKGGKASLPVRLLIRQTDPSFRSHIGASALQGVVVDETSTIESFTNPVALVHFNEDAFSNLSFIQSLNLRNLWQNKIQIISGASHCGVSDEPAAFNNLLLQYAESIF